ncbi:MAG: formate dehydrogenase subunit delta [Nocardioides sp.]|jgi:formate dehydrogenase subunit delta
MSEHAQLPAEARMGNDIARQFAHLPQDQAISRIADHIGRFWEPRMRANLKVVADGDPQSLDPLILAVAQTF